METMDDFKDELEASFRQIREGDIITGTVIAVSEEEITLDLKYYAQGIIKVEDFSNDPDFAVLEQIHAGDEIEATVVKTDDGQGNILLSRKEANDVLAWEKLQQMMEDGTVVKVRIKESVPSGVVAFLEGIRAFIPASQLALDYVENTEEWIGKEVEAKVITVDPEKEKLVLSARQVAKEAAIEERNHKISMIVPGTVMEGTVESLMPYGAFINLGNGLSGLVHISQICEKRRAKILQEKTPCIKHRCQPLCKLHGTCIKQRTRYGSGTYARRTACRQSLHGFPHQEVPRPDCFRQGICRGGLNVRYFQ